MNYFPVIRSLRELIQFRERYVSRCISPLTSKSIPYCHQCNIPMSFLHKTLMFWIVKKEKDQILFFYTCPRCKYRRGIYDNGKELEPIERICEKCGGKDIKKSMDTKKNGDFVFKEKCLQCGHEKKDTHKHFEEKIDPNYETDRRRYIMTNQEVLEFHIWQKSAEEILGRREERKNYNSDEITIEQGTKGDLRAKL